MSDNEINSGVSTSCCSEGPPSGHQPHDPTDQNGRRSWIGHGSPGARKSHSRAIGTPRSSTSSRFDRSGGNPARMQLLTDGVCIELLIPGWRLAQAFELSAARYRRD
jgi:hypothetical protein